MCAIFLLVLLADVARSYASAPVGNDAAGGLILSAAGQLSVSSTSGAILSLRGSDNSLPSVNRKSQRLALFGWSRALDQSNRWSQLDSFVQLASLPGLYLISERYRTPSSLSISPSLAIFEHSGSPAP